MTYGKLWGLDELKKSGLNVPEYIVFELKNITFIDYARYIDKKLENFIIPSENNDRIGVTIRVSFPEMIDKVGTHGGLHVINKDEIIQQVISKKQEYGDDVIIFIQHTVDANCSGSIIKEKDRIIIETIPGDAPELLEGRTNDFEIWMKTIKWNNIRRHSSGEILNIKMIKNIEDMIMNFPNNSYFEWSISKNGKIYFYEYLLLK